MAKKTGVEKAEVHSTVAAIRALNEELSKELTIDQLTRNLKTILAASKVDSAISSEDSANRREQQVAWLKKSLQAAVTLEFATIPPYLCALWSIDDELSDAAKIIREVVQEEMLHMALACNMLTSLGETPRINTAVVVYPGPLPGGVHKGLTVHLSGLTKSLLSDFLWIERPVEEVPIQHPYPGGKKGEEEDIHAGHDHDADETIGEFYEQIRLGFKAYLADSDNPRLSPDNQVSGPLAYAVIRSMKDVKFAIDLIQSQGEGSPNNPEKSRGGLSHYYRFLEIRLEKTYKWNKVKGELEITGDLPFPKTLPVARIPAGGYKKEDVSDEVWYHLDEFDNTYSKLIDQLQGAWTLGGQASLVHAYETMFALQKHAKKLMQTRTPFGSGATYGPCFRYKEESERS